MLVRVVIISTDYCSSARHGTWHIISRLLVETTPGGYCIISLISQMKRMIWSQV